MKSTIQISAFIALLAGLTFVGSPEEAISEQPAAGSGIAAELEPNETVQLRVTYHLKRIDGRALAAKLRELYSASGHGVDIQSTLDAVTITADAKLHKSVIDLMSAIDLPSKTLTLPR